MKKIFSALILLSLVIPSLSFAKLEDKVENRGVRMENRMERASTTEKRLENREDNIERIRERIASTTLATTSTSTIKRMENLENRLAKQQDQIEKVKDRLLNKELKITEVLGKIADKIQARITILEGKSLNMTAAKAKLAEANAKITEMTTETSKLATLLETVITEANQTQLFQDIKESQDKIRTLARTSHALLVDTIKEITKVLPKNGNSTTTATTTATSTD